MARSITLNSTSYSIPQTGDSGWSLTGGVDDYLVALSTGVLTKAGGTFTLTAEVNTGATYGFKSAYFKTQTASPSSVGVFRLANDESVGWRNGTNTGDVALKVDSANRLIIGSGTIPTTVSSDTFTGKTMDGGSNTFTNLPTSALTGTVTPTHGGTGQDFSASTGLVKVAAGTMSVASLVNADVSSSAAIAYSKLALTGAILNADLAGSIAYSKLSLTGAILNADLAGSIAYSKLSLTGAILNADLAGSIAYSKLSLTGAILNADLAGSIAYSKLSLSGSIATADLASGLLVPLTKGGTGQTTANAALNALLPSQTTANGKVLSSNGTDTSWASALTSTLASGSTFVGVAGTATAVDTAAQGQVTASSSGLTINAASVTNAMLAGSIAYSKLTLTGAILNADLAGSIAGSKLTVDATGALVTPVSTTTQTFAGAKTWNDAQTFKYSSGASTAGSYNTSGNWTWGASGSSATTHTSFGTIKHSRSDTSTDLTAPNTYGSSLQNTDTTSNNYSGHWFLEGNGNPVASIVAVNQVHSGNNTLTQGKLVLSAKPASATTNGYPVARAEIAGDGTSQFFLGTGATFKVRGQGNTVNVFVVDENMSSTTTGTSDSVGISIQKGSTTSTTSQRFMNFSINAGSTNSGAIAANGASTAAFVTSSDMRLKENIANLSGSLAKILALRPVEFDYIAGGHQTGFIAQEMQAIFPEDVSADDVGMLGIAGWSKQTAHLVKAIQEQQEQIELLKAQILALQ